MRKNHKNYFKIIGMIVMFVNISGCGEATLVPPDFGNYYDSDSGDSDTNPFNFSDTDADKDSVSDTYSDTDSETEIDSSSESDSNAGTGSDVATHDLFDIMEGGYVYAGDWAGFVWSSPGEVPGSSIAPADFSLLTGDETQLCVSGSLAKNDNAVGMLGLNVNQSTLGGTGSESTWTPSAENSGVYVDITKNKDTVVRLQLKGADGTEWCTELSDGVNNIPWSSLVTNCWEAGGAEYNKEPLSQVVLLVPGGKLVAVSFDFCLNEFYPIDGAIDTDPDTGSDTGVDTGSDTGVDTVDTGVDTVDTGVDTVDTGVDSDTTVHALFDIMVGGYVYAGDWSGYAWTGTETPSLGSTITPADYSLYTGDETALCASGSVAKDAGYGGTAMIGFNLNQAEGATAIGTVTPAKSGVYVDVTNKTAAALRVQIQASDGGTNAAHRWCANITNGTQTIPYTSFNTECWVGGNGKAYDNTPLAAAMIIVPGSNSAAIPFNFCLNALYEK
ncbi:MAG: hypothetical protein JXR91_04925 [Deltaproteobacteria bacterium]|nr:hypothetical protein [Deltaproteobacteria bacterium]